MFEELYETKTEASTGATEVATTKPADVALEDIDLQKLALAYFDPSRAAAKAAKEKLTDVVHDLSTAGKLAEAKSLRNRLINIPLAEARKVSSNLKSKLTVTSKAVGAELTSIESEFEAAEKHITPQIEARDAELAAEKAERDRKEAERVAAHRANIAKLAGYVAQLQGKTSAQILAAINQIDAIDILPEQWEEFAAGAEIQKAETIEALQALFNATKTAEDEAAAREAQRIENERVAAELTARAAELAEKQAEVDRKLAAIAAAEKAEADRIEAAAQAQRDAAAESLQRAADATPPAVIADAYAAAPAPLVDMDEVSAKAWAMPADPITFCKPAATEAPEPYTGRMAVSTGVLHPTPEPATHGPITFAEPAEADPLASLLAHIDEAFTGRFPAHPKPSPDWWGTLRHLTDEAREYAEA